MLYNCFKQLCLILSCDTPEFPLNNSHAGSRLDLHVNLIICLLYYQRAVEQVDHQEQQHAHGTHLVEPIRYHPHDGGYDGTSRHPHDQQPGDFVGFIRFPFQGEGEYNGKNI